MYIPGEKNPPVNPWNINIGTLQKRNTVGSHTFHKNAKFLIETQFIGL